MNLIEKLYYYSHQYWDDIGDPRVNNFMVIRGGIWKILSIVGFYLFLVNYLLPEYMKNRILVLYNLIMVCLNIYGVYWSAWSLDYGTVLFNFKYPSREDYSARTKWLLTLGWVYMMARMGEFLDTVFFVLRKRWRQMTSLHLYHHSVVPFCCWLSFKYNGMIPFIRLYLFLNTTVHVFVYSYLLFTSLIPALKTHLWIKRSLIKLEIIQFIILGVYGIVLYFKQTGYPMVWFGFIMGQTPLFFVLFCNAYKKVQKNKKLI